MALPPSLRLVNTNMQHLDAERRLKALIEEVAGDEEVELDMDVKRVRLYDS